jgi:hypothetical protein
MSANGWTEEDTARALHVWEEYQRQYDVSSKRGQAVGIDPVSGRVWFGESAKAIRQQLDEQHIATLLFLRVGYDHYLRKGRQR